MSESHVALAVDLADLDALYPVLEIESPRGRQAAFLAFVDEQFDSEYEEDLEIEDIVLEGGWVIVEYLCSDELCEEVTQALFSGLEEHDTGRMAALVHDGRIGVYSLLAPGYDEVAHIDEVFEDFDGLMQELEEVRDRREMLLHVLELLDAEPLREQLAEYLGEDVDDEPAEPETADEADPVEDSPVDIEDLRVSLMAELKQAMAEGDEERAAELFERVQQL